MSDAVDRLAQALRDLIREAVQEAVEQERAKPPPARVVERPKVPEEDFEAVPGATRNICGISCQSRKHSSSWAASASPRSTH